MAGLPHYQTPQLPVPSLAFGSSTMALERALQYEVGIRDRRIHELELDNMRLMVKLEQAENDVRVATNMIMVASRSGSKDGEHEARSAGMAIPRRVEDLRLPTNKFRNRVPVTDNHWGAIRSEEDLTNGSSNVHYKSGFCGSGGDAQGTRRTNHHMQEGWTDRPSEHESDAEENTKAGQQVEEGRGMTLGTRKIWGWSETETDLSSRLGLSEKEASKRHNATRSIRNNSPKLSVAASASLLDCDDDLETDHYQANAYRTPPPLRPSTPLDKVIGVTLADPFVTDRKAKNKAVDAAPIPVRASDLPFRHLFDFDTDDSLKPKSGKGSAEDTTDDYTKSKRDVLSKVTAPDLISAIPEIEIPVRREVVRTPDPLLTALYGRKASEETIYPTTDEHKIEPGHEPAKVLDQEPEQQISSESDPIILQYPTRNNRDDRRGRRPRSNAYDGEPMRFNPNKPPPSTEHDVAYKPLDTANNYLRTVMIYNLPPQVDIAEVIGRAGDAPLLSIKLLPTMGMKSRNADGTIAIMDTATAMMTFFLDTSAEQFVFDAPIEPIVIRGRTAVVKLLETPTYPSCLHRGAYATAPGRLFSRRIRFHQPGLVPSEHFADVLAGNSVGYKQPGWIVDKTMKKEAGKNMITVEFASVETAAFAFGQMMWVRAFQGCDPRMVFDHEAGASRGHRGGLKTRDDEESGVEEGLGDEVEQEVVAGEPNDALSSSKYAAEVEVYDGPEATSFVAPPVPSFSFKLAN